MPRIAIVGMACRYPDAASPSELWENALAGRRAFRRLPDVRMRLADYWDADPASPDRFYARTAAVIQGYEFDRTSYKIAGSTYRSTDLTHWLALDMAARALADAGYPMAGGLPTERTCVVVGNTLTGEFSRAGLMRLRWPYVRRTVAAALAREGWADDKVAGFLDDLEVAYKSPFPEINEDSLAGGLSNTISGRICNQFDLKGGGYTVDGACSSSLLSVATACRALLDGEADVALAGGVDLSIDPFEIVGFAKAGALAKGEMRVYDRDSNGFWPGEGCGMVVLMREHDAKSAARRIYAAIAGWGVSSDGKGGITRPEVSGYQLALRRAYERAGFGIDTVAMFEGHGTGTQVGDATELEALATARTAANPVARPAAIGTIKGMIGHTKAAAGVAGLIKAALAVHHQVLPPTIGCRVPHPVLAETGALRVLRKAEPWPAGEPVRAGVSAMGFGGINTHLVLTEARRRRRKPFDQRTRALACSVQDVELLLADGGTPGELRERLARLAAGVGGLSYAQLADLAVIAQRELRGLPYRAALVVSSPDGAQRQLQCLLQSLEAGETTLFAADGGSFLGHVTRPGRIGYLFPGQGSGHGPGGGALRRRFASVDDLYAAAALPATADLAATATAQPRIVTGSMAGLRALSALGLEAVVALGHSLGEISALHWAGALDQRSLLRVAGVRGQTMAEHGEPGSMAGIAAPPDTAAALLAGLPVVVAGYNGPDQTVIAGPHDAVDVVAGRAAAAGLPVTKLAVSHAFHSPLVARAADVFGRWLAGETFGLLERRVVSTVTGQALARHTDIAALLRRQITGPVLFAHAVELAVEEADLLIEVGPGQVLAKLAATVSGVPTVALDTDDESLRGLLRVAAAAHVAGAPVDCAALFDGRLIRPLPAGPQARFFASPCEQAPITAIRDRADRPAKPATTGNGAAPDRRQPAPGQPAPGQHAQASLEVVRQLVAETAELPLSMIDDDSRLLDGLHLSSITVGNIMNQAALRLGLPPAQGPANFATASLRELAQALDELAQTARAGDSAPALLVAGAAAWARPFAIDLDELPILARTPPQPDGRWHLYATPDDPLAGRLRGALESSGVGPGVLVCLPADCSQQHLELALRGAQSALGGDPGSRFVLVQHDRGAAGLAKTLHLEAPHLRVTIAHVPPVAAAAGWVADEVAATASYAEVYYDHDGVRRVPTLRALPVRPARTTAPLHDGDVLLVTGGGKGITAECALALASDSGATLAVLGRSDPATDTELAANLARMTEHGVTVRYARADVTDPGQVRQAVAALATRTGPVTAVLHGAGRNEPSPLASLDMAAVGQTLAPKIDGLRNVLAAIDPGRLRLLVTFGSIIGRAGLRGEAHYAIANEWLADATAELARQYPQCRSTCMEWSVWSGIGMGERLSVVEGLAREGVTPISPDQGVQILRRLVTDPDVPQVVVVSGRTGAIDTVRHAAPPLPLLRFAEQTLLRYDGVELVTQTELNAGTDLYLADHLIDGSFLFPAVFGMEAMAQVAAAATGWSTLPVIEQAEFARPIVVPPDASTTIRVAATVVDDDTVAVAIRSAETGFAAEHFRAMLRFTGARAPAGPPGQVGDDLPPVPLAPDPDLYGGLLFQGRRFQRLRRYHRAAARHVDADVEALAVGDWFAGYLPSTLLLGDPGLRDALMHGNQVCVPDATLLPSGIERVYPGGAGLADAGELRYCATERGRDGDSYIYDIALRTHAGEVVERWEGLCLRAVRKGGGGGPWLPALVGPYLERAVEDLVGMRVAVAVEPYQGDSAMPVGERREHTAIAVGRALGYRARVRYRGDGRPEIDGGQAISASHGAGVTLCVVAAGLVGCDVEPVAHRQRPAWAQLLGSHAPVAGQAEIQSGESHDTSCTRVWTAIESMRKAGLPTLAPITLGTGGPGDWTVFVAGSLRIATLVTTLRDAPDPVVFAVLAGREF
jgi:enediyne polyketide synthase